MCIWKHLIDKLHKKFERQKHIIKFSYPKIKHIKIVIVYMRSGTFRVI